MVERIQQRLEQVRQQRQEASLRAGQHQEQLNKAIVEVHQYDGAIAAFEDLLRFAEQETK